jgi:hypothetical protein
MNDLASVLYQLEVQAAYVTAIIEGMRDCGVGVIEVKQSATDDHNSYGFP